MVAAGVLIRDHTSRVLIVDPTYKPLWEMPGGVVEVGEAPPDAAAPECVEELGKRGYRFVDPVEAGELLGPQKAARIAAALEALHDGSTTELVDGARAQINAGTGLPTALMARATGTRASSTNPTTKNTASDTSAPR
jgi:ADP-ribose pyrophosphatase YjhB (NUDIX family)